MKPQSSYGKLSKMPKTNAANPPLVVVGTVAIDKVETPFGKKERVFGGSASYFSYAASFFTPVALSAVVGKDFPEEYRKVLEERPINLDHLEVREGETFSWTGKYESDLNTAHTLETRLNVLLEFDPVLNFKTHPSFLFLANVDPEIQGKVLNQLEKPRLKFVACDTMNFWISNKREALLQTLARVDCLVINDGEARQLTGEPNLIRAAQKITDLGPDHVIIKKGEHGVLLHYEGQLCALPAYPLESVFDPTGAGDTFAGGVMGYLTQAGEVTFENMKRAIAYGTVLASHTVEDFGLEALRKIRMEDLEKRLDLFKKISRF